MCFRHEYDAAWTLKTLVARHDWSWSGYRIHSADVPTLLRSRLFTQSVNQSASQSVTRRNVQTNIVSNKFNCRV